MNKRLIIIEGFDRSGKDTLMKDLNKLNLTNTYIYFNDLEGLPKYDKEQDSFLNWLNKFIQRQVNDLNKLFDTYDTIIMTRLLISDEVYSTLFNREHTTIKYMKLLRKDIEIYNYCILFDNYNEYLKRLDKINDKYVQYNHREFDAINQLYFQLVDFINNSKINLILANTLPKDILDNFLKLYNYDK